MANMVIINELSDAKSQLIISLGFRPKTQVLALDSRVVIRDHCR